MGRKRKQEQRNKRRIFWPLAALVAVLVCMGALLVYRSGVLNLAHGGSEIISKVEPFTYENGTQQMFAPVKGGVAVANTTGLQVLDKNGVTMARSIVSMKSPALASAGDRAAAYDVGGTALRVGDPRGNVTVLDQSDAIISVTMNAAGYLAVVTEETGYKGLVTVYNEEFDPVYRWHSGTNYVLRACVSPDCQSMAALTLEESGGAVHVFSLSSEEEYAVFSAPGVLLFDCAFLGNDRLCGVHDGGLVFFTAAGVDGGSWSFGGQFLNGYSFDGDGFVTAVLSQYQTGSVGSVVTVGYGGSVTGQMTPQDAVQSVSVRDKQVLIRYGEYTAVYSQSLEETDRVPGGQGAKDAVLFDRNKGFLLYSGYCEPVTF